MENRRIINIWLIKAKNLKILIFIIGGVFLISGFLFAHKIVAYSDQTTHPDLTREIISFYELSTGKKFTDEQKQWIIQGSIDEDLAPRWLNHFYDPVFERGLSTEVPGISGYLAKNWAQFSSYQTINPVNIANLWTGKGPVISGNWYGDFSYEAAIKDYSKNKEKEAYLDLGHVLHLIEDMTVPEHTRNDPHPGGNMASFYEDWAMRNSSGLTQDLGKRIFNQGRKPVIYTDLEIYFNNLANYTNSYFFSPRTINSKIYQKPKIVFEDGTFAYGKDENNRLFDLAYILERDYITKKVNYTINKSQILQEYWLRLSRQAIINGAGIINLFSNQAEAARQAELAKQKVDANGSNKSRSSFISFITGLFSLPGDKSSEPAMTIIVNEPQPTAPKINPIAPKKTPAIKVPAVPSATTPVKPSLPEHKPVSTKTQTPIPTPVPTPTTPTPTPNLAPTPNPNPNPAPVVTYSGGSSNTNTTSNSSAPTFSVGDLVINEIMYDLAKSDCVADGTDANREWVEIYNNSGRAITLTGGNSGWRFNDGSNHLLNESGTIGSMTIPAGGFAILSASSTVFLLDHVGFSGTVIDTAMSLKNTSATIKISAPDGTIIDEVTYYSFWGAKHNCKTLSRKSVAGNSNDSANWAESLTAGGTPGIANDFSLVVSDVDANASTTSDAATSTPELANLGTDVPATTTISQNTTWTLSGSPYRLFFDFVNRPTVASGATLTIEPGVKIIPQSGGATALEIKGTLNAVATSGAPIIFTSINDADDSASTTPQKGDWLNIAFTASSTGNLDYVEFRYGGGQNLVLPFYEMVDIAGATINIDNSKFENSKSVALHLKDSSGTVQNSVFSDNYCGISVDSVNGVANTAYGGCYGIYTTGQILSSTDLQIKNNQFVRNQLIGIETRSGTTPTIDGNIFSDNGYPIKIESSYPSIAHSQLANIATSTSIISGIAISGHTHFSQNFTLKKDLPYILESNGPDLAPYVDSGATLTIEPGTILKSNNINSTLFINGSLVSNGTFAEPVIFTSLKDDADARDGDWGNIKFNAGSVGNLTNTNFYYGTVDTVSFPNNPNLSATSLISQCPEGNKPAEYSFDADSKIAFSFASLSDVARGQITVPLRKASNSPGSLRFSLQDNAGDNPSGNYLSLTDIDQAGMDFTFKNFKLPFGVGIGNSSLIASTTYWTVMENIGGPGDQFYLKNSGGDTCAGAPKFWDSSKNGPGSESAAADIIFRVDKIDSFLPIIVDANASVVVQ